MTCCIQTPEQNVPPAVPPVSTHSISEFTVALMASTRPLLWLFPVETNNFLPYGGGPLTFSAIALEMLCIRLI